MKSAAADSDSMKTGSGSARLRPVRLYVTLFIACSLSVYAVDPDAADNPVLYVATSIGEEGIIPILPAANPREATISVWNIYDAGILTRSRISSIRRSETTVNVRSLHLWNLTEPYDWTILRSFPNLEELTITGMWFEDLRLFYFGSKNLKRLTIQDSLWSGNLSYISLKSFPSLAEFAITFYFQEELPLINHIPPTLRTVSLRYNYRLEIRPIPKELEALAGVSEINISPLYALPPVYRRFPQLRESLGPWEGDYLPKPR